MTGFSRALPFGATLVDRNRARFRLFAPAQPSVAVDIEDAQSIPMQPQGDGWFEAEVPCDASAHYCYVLANGRRVPDPTSRAKAGDVHDRSIVIDPTAYQWRNRHWRGRPWPQTVLYELHCGAFGGFRGVARELPRLAALGKSNWSLLAPVSVAGQQDFEARDNSGEMTSQIQLPICRD